VQTVFEGSVIDLLTGTRALRGRAALDLVMRRFRTAARFWGIEDPRVAFTVHAVVGGTPGYRDLMPAMAPRRQVDVAGWLARGPLNPASALFREDDYLLTEERNLSDRALYHSVVTAIARGNTTQATIAVALGRESRSVQHPLRMLEEAGFVTRTDDVLRSRRPLYAIADPIVRFHHVITRRDLARFEDRRTAEAWKAAQDRFSTHVRGPHFDELAREWTRRWAEPTTIGGVAETVDPAVINDRAGWTKHQVDVVAVGLEPSGASRLLAIGEAKHSRWARTRSDLARLDSIRSMLTGARQEAADAKLLLFSAGGFDRRLEAAASERPDVEPVDLERLYRGT
jgi:DNA-binding transcriptional ArsR family regulator